MLAGVGCFTKGSRPVKVSSLRAFAKPTCEECTNPPAPAFLGARRPHSLLLLAAVLSTLVVAVPVLYLIVRASQADADTWYWLLSKRLPGLMQRTFLLTAGTTVLATAIALPLAWLVSRTDIPGKRWLNWLSALPLVFPPYIGAFIFVTLVGPAGVLVKWFANLRGVPVSQLNIPNINSLGGAIIVVAFFTYPYVYLLLCSALRGTNQSLEEAARSAGLRQREVFWRITLPMLRPALTAGALLVGLYALSDYGTVAILRLETFTSAIYMQMTGRFDRTAAAALSLVLVAITLLLLYFEDKVQKQGARYYSAQWKPARPVPLGRWKLPAMLFAWSVTFLTVGLPVLTLIYWSFSAYQQGVVTAAMFKYAWNSLFSAGGAAVIAMVLAFPIAYLSVRYPGPLSRILHRFSYVGYALPGVVVALGAIFFFHKYLNPIYGTVYAMMAAYVIRFLPQSLGATHSGLGALPPSLEDAGRSLGLNAFGVLRQITLPLITPSVITGFALVFLNSLKELPASLLLRPAGYDTLAVRVWIEASEGHYSKAAPVALLLLILAAIPMILLLRRVLQGQARLS